MTHPGYMAFLTYDEVKARLQKFIHKPGRWDSNAHICTDHWTVDSSEAVSWPTLACEGDAGAEAGETKGSMALVPNLNALIVAPQSDVSVLGPLTGSPSVSQAGVTQYEVKNKGLLDCVELVQLSERNCDGSGSQGKEPETIIPAPAAFLISVIVVQRGGFLAHASSFF